MLLSGYLESGSDDFIVSRSLLLCPLCSTGGGGKIEGHALVSPGPARPERHQPRLITHAHRSRRS